MPCNHDCNQGRNCVCSKESPEELKLYQSIYLLVLWLVTFLAVMVVMYSYLKTAL
jgi:hypothetical protein